MMIPFSIGLFVLAGLCEIGGGYLVWLWLREGKPVGYAFVGAAILVLYGVIPTFQPVHFGRVYAAYGGMFVVLSLLWGWGLDGTVSEKEARRQQDFSSMILENLKKAGVQNTRKKERLVFNQYGDEVLKVFEA